MKKQSSKRPEPKDLNQASIKEEKKRGHKANLTEVELESRSA